MKAKTAKMLTLLYLYLTPLFPALFAFILFYENPLLAFLSSIVIYFGLQYLMAYTLRMHMEKKQIKEETD